MEFRLLGIVETLVDGSPVDLGPRRQRLVLAVLALEANRLVSVDRLVELSWPTAPPRTAVHAVRVSVSQLRMALARADAGRYNVELSGNGSGYMLRTDAMRVDAHRFRGLVERARGAPSDERKAALIRQALSLWRGPALTGIGPAETREGLACGLEEGRLVALEERIEAELGLGRHRELLDELTEMAEAHPLRERLAAQLMVALYRSGQAGAALAAFQRTRNRLAQELGMDPCAELQQLELAMLRSDAALAAPKRTQVNGCRPGAVPGPKSGTHAAAYATAVAGTGPGPAVSVGAGPAARTEASAGAVSIVGAVANWLASRPAQLPPAVADFTGRAAQLLKLREMADERDETAPSASIIVITGPAGVGKTALAVRWARQFHALFGDGQLFVDLRGYAHEPPLIASATLGRFLRALGVARKQAPSDPEEAAALYRTLLHDKQLLVFLDNAATAEQVRPLLPAASRCLTLITSRDRLAGLVALDGARCLSLDVLRPDEARTLLTKLVGRHRFEAELTALDRLASMCGYLPLALRIGAANLVSHPGQSVSEYAAELEKDSRLAALEVGGDQHSALRTAFDLSYLTVGADARRLFRLLGLVLNLDITAAVAAELIGEGPGRAWQLLDELARAHLIREHASGRFTIGNLLRVYAKALAQTEDSEQERAAAIALLQAAQSIFAP
jgi:DNA-binding SARP family transcriptional activator